MEDWAAWNITRYKVDDLIPYERNPRIHPQSQIDQLAQSIREWGWTMPILIDESANVIAGHGRLFAAQELDIDEVPCITASGWSDQQKKAYVIADNKLTENASWDDGLYFSELRSLQENGFDLSKVGMDSDFSFDDFEPSLQPITDFTNFSPDDIHKASDKLSNQMTSLKESDGIEVMCPYCAETFTFSGT